ncbi:MAG: hypothetical protein COU42_00490 [Candidatus Nealsonbacteria bacterium CG10_big_fil_rev_8_21_14_0_10_36_24]|uniref:Uncharacterized protein n=2 Tax=Candidatus Nealsoniibacteriota TaxID=1817911 RepID=A0A2H0YNB9_9BACT|nr:MAG: hypothetical protein COU42_00490 [Candidatus Nealsonbacteria bacterium CG10_big_fil_rev_8_21_14_0_10_36_24]PIS40005.1 MAG: hypothetical protein COT32_02045 [Candidatus Nealsonbacteria bacterium CG08_land_8_20_14_0_20_36_22]
MTNNIEVQNLKKEYPEFFKKHSPELLEFIFSENTSSKIAEICLGNKIEDEEKIEKIANRTVSALLGEFPKENLPEVLEKGVNLEFKTAIEISEQINQLIFSQIPKTKPEKIQKGEIKTEKEKITPGKALFQ